MISSWLEPIAPGRGQADVGVARCWELQDISGLTTFPGAGEPSDLEAVREQEREEAYRQGRADGEQAAHVRARREMETAVAATRRALQQIREARESWDERLEANLVALATAIARHLLGRELTGDAQAVRALVQQALSAFPLDHAVRIRLNPSDLELLAPEGSEPTAGDGATDGHQARWIADDAVSPGGCVVEGPDQIVDGRVGEALERIYWELTRG